jgi:hypothetical protein
MPHRSVDRTLRGLSFGTTRLKEWLGVRMREVQRHPAAPKRSPVDELQYIKNEADYISAAVDSTKGLLKPEDLERVIALTRVLEQINRRGPVFLAASDKRKFA